MIAEVFTREVDLADFVFLLAVILGVVAALAAWPQRTVTNVAGWFAVAAIALGLMLL